MKLLKIRELKIDDTEMTGVQAISFVDFPAIETNFEYFAAHKKIIRVPDDITKEDLDVKYRWVLNHDNELENNVCPTCIEWSNQAPKTLRTWISTALPRVPVNTKLVNVDMVVTGAHEPYNTYCEANCGCHLEAVEENLEKNFNVEFKIDNAERREVVGCVLKSNQMIYRRDVGNGPGYVWFSRETVRGLMKKFGYNRNITFQHVQNRKGSVIMMKSWIEEKDNETSWFVRYKVIDNNLWEQIKAGIVKGFSIEASFK